MFSNLKPPFFLIIVSKYFLKLKITDKMKRITLTLTTVVVFLVTSFAQNNEIYFTDYPTLTPDGKTTVFSYQSDLWKMPTAGGLATKITSMEGSETLAKISPDGKWLAFSGTPNGNADIYIMPLAGGEIRQLTYHQATDRVSSWSWDNSTIYFTSNRENRMSSYSIDVNGGTPKRLFPHYFNNIHNLVEHPQSGEFYFNETWESDGFENRKRYKGAYNPDIKSYNPTTKEFTVYTDYEGKDFQVTIDKNGSIYFLSDELNGEYNLYTFKNGEKQNLTKFDKAIHRPFVNADGTTVIFQKEYQLFTYTIADGQTQKVPVNVARNTSLAKEKDFEVSGKITAFAVSPDGKKLAFVSRGELFVSDIKGKYPKQLKTAVDGRVMEVVWLKDNKTLIFNQTVRGYQNWFKIGAAGKTGEKQLTKDSQNNRNLVLNSDRTKGVYLSGRNEVRLMDMKTLASTLLFEEELWGFYNDIPLFAPDDKHLVLSAYRNFEQEIFVYNVETKQKKNITNTGVSEFGAFWSPDGKYLYFTANPTEPAYPYGSQRTDLFKLSLERLDSPFKSDKFDELFVEEAEEKEEDQEGEESEEKEEEKPTVTIDFEDIMERVERFGPTFGSQFGMIAMEKEGKRTVLFSSNHDEGDFTLFKWEKEPFEKAKTKKIEGTKGSNYYFSEADGTYYVLNQGKIHELKLVDNEVEEIEIAHTFRRNLQAEFEQMYYETWAGMEENFYDENFHGVDWQKLRDDYAEFLPYLNNRADLRLLLNDLLGELNTSHFGFRSRGKEESTYYKTTTLATGILFDNENPYVVERIIKKSPADRKGKDIKAGDKLISVNGKVIDTQQNRASYFTQPSSDEELELTFLRNGNKVTVKLHPTSYFNQRNLLYDEWMAERQSIVDAKGNKKIAYVHMKNMGGGQLDHFKKQMVSEGHQRDALILDLRYNTGGNVHDAVLQFLSQKPYLQWKYREGKLTNQPNFVPASKPIVLLINEQSLSDAEMTATGFKELKLGTIVGTETYRWIIFTTGKGLVDGSFYRLPSWGCYTLDGKNIEKTGVAPDIFIQNTFKDRLEGNDPQLDKAIELILEQLKG